MFVHPSLPNTNTSLMVQIFHDKGLSKGQAAWHASVSSFASLTLLVEQHYCLTRDIYLREKALNIEHKAFWTRHDDLRVVQTKTVIYNMLSRTWI